MHGTQKQHRDACRGWRAAGALRLPSHGYLGTNTEFAGFRVSCSCFFRKERDRRGAGGLRLESVLGSWVSQLLLLSCVGTWVSVP